jgi:beta-phosphoglucomutase-like phosphatase (HAD superfamily)
MLAVFDNDGTICDTQEVEGRCFARAIAEVIGRSLPTTDWSAYEETTCAAIARELLAGDRAARTTEAAIERAFVRLLVAERPSFPGDFCPLRGAISFIQRLKADRICAVAIATGCFAASARFKLQCCGITLDDYPHATSSDTSRRSDIIRLSAARAGFDLSSVIYFGDAPWDVRASHVLGIPMIGIGRRWEHLRTLGIRHAFRDYTDADAIIRAMLELRACDQSRDSKPAH